MQIFAANRPRRDLSDLCCLILACACISLQFSDEAFSQDSSWPLDWGEWQTATGDWGGYRSKLMDMGIDTQLNYTQDIMANPVGGERQSAAYSGGLFGMINLDFDRLIGLNGSSFSIGFYQGLGRDLSADDINNIFSVNQIFVGDVFGISQMNFLQTLANDRFEFAIGRLSTGSDFAYSDAFPLYVSSGVNGNPAQLLENVPSFTTPPFSQWGVRGTVKPQDFLYVSAGAYNADINAQDNEDQGLVFKFNPEDGVLAIGEVGLLIGKDEGSAYLPGQYMLGGYYDSSDYTPFTDSTETIEGNWGLYAIADQRVYEEDGDQGLNLWGLFTLAPRQSINSLPYGVSGGAYYKGLIPGRDHDITAGAFFLGIFSDDLRGQTYELAFELNHRFQLNHWAYWTADFQFIRNPNGQRNISDAWVFGTEFSIDF